MKTKSTKSLLLGLSLMLAAAAASAQAPFGTPPGGNLQPPTPDKIVPNVPTDYVGGMGRTYSGGTGGIPACAFSDINRTGNDIKRIQETGDIAEAMVWDGDCPSFSFIVSGNAATQSPLQSAFVVNLEANNHGIVSDPDIIISYNAVSGNTIGILIVYRFTYGSGAANHVAYEQWNYDYSTNTIYFVPTGPQPNIISSGVDSDSPNIDGNNENEIAIVYDDGIFNVSSYVDYFTATTSINTANRIALNTCGFNGQQPDVAISDHSISSSFVSYIYVNYPDLVLHQEEFAPLYATLTPSCINVSVIGSDYLNPRIATPEDLTHATEYAAVAELNDPGNQQIDLFHNFAGAGTLTTITLNSTLATNGCDSDYPAIAFPEDHFISVAWTYDDCSGFISGDKEVIGVSYYLVTPNRIPMDPNYYMLVSQNTGGDQHAVSLASERQTNLPSTHAPVLYSFGSPGTTEMKYKLSSVSNQPQVRKKAIVNANDQISIYPNPAKNFVNIDFSSLQAETAISLRILSIEGKTVYEKNGLPNTFNQGVDLNNFDSGIYLIEYRYNDTVKQEKLIVQQ